MAKHGEDRGEDHHPGLDAPRRDDPHRNNEKSPCDKKGNIVSYTLEELERMPSRTDWAKVDATTQAALARRVRRRVLLVRVEVAALPP